MTYNGLLHEWKILSASRAINTMAYTPAGILSMQTTGDQAIIDLAPLESVTPERREFERGLLIRDAAMVGLHLTAEAKDAAGACCASRPIKFLTGAPSAGFSGRWATKTTKEFETT
jgi:hypothetical protein